MTNYVERFLGRFRNVSLIEPGRWSASCPAHDDSSPSLSISLASDGKLLHRCFAGCAGDRVREAAGLKWADYWPSLGEEPLGGSRVEAMGVQPVPDKVPDSTFHTYYSDLLKLLSLSEDHRKGLLARGLSDEVITANEYRTVSWAKLSQALGTLEKVYGRERLLQVPGFRLSMRKDRLEIVAESGGLLIPVRGLNGQILALKVRGSGKPKYRWMSGDGTPSVGSPVHLPLGPRPEPGDQIQVVEGPLKADVVQSLNGTPTLGIGGLGAWKNVIPVLRSLKPGLVNLDLDADWQVNPAVATTLRDMLLFLPREFMVRVDVWPLAQGKGLDDYWMLGGKGIEPKSVDEILPQVVKVINRSK